MPKIFLKMFKTIRYILNHPLSGKDPVKSVLRYFSWQLGYRINPYPILYPFIENSKLIVKKGMTGATGNIYVGLHDFEEMGFMLHLLRQDDLFADIGANIGSYTVLASNVAEAYTISFEPVPSTFKHLLDNIYINNIIHKVKCYNIGLGEKNSILKFSSSLDTVNHALTTEERDSNYVEVQIGILDDYCIEKTPLLLKMDVEGFEYNVLQGSKQTLKNPELKAIIIELNQSSKRYGIEDETIHQFLISFGFKPYLYGPFKRLLKEMQIFRPNGNTIYLRDIDFIRKRIESQRKIKVHSVEF